MIKEPVCGKEQGLGGQIKPEKRLMIRLFSAMGATRDSGIAVPEA